MKILDVGCGNKLVVKNNYTTIGIDIRKETMADVICNLEYNLPFKTNTFDEIICDNILEHIYKIVPLLEELYRVGKSKAIIKILSPHFSGMDTHQEITHVRGFGSRTFYPFTGKGRQYGNCKFKQLKRKINFWEIVELCNIKPQEWIGLGIFANKLTSIYERFFCYIFPAHTIYFELEIIK